MLVPLIHCYSLNTTQAGPRCHPQCIWSEDTVVVCAVQAGYVMQPERWSRPTVSVLLRHLQKAVSLPSDQISGQNKEFQHFCQRSERLISLWVSVDRRQQYCAADLLMWTGNRLAQSKQHKAATYKTNMAAGFLRVMWLWMGAGLRVTDQAQLIWNFKWI